MASPDSTQPKSVQKLVKRTAGLLIAVAVIFGGYRWATERRGDFDLGGDGAGMIAAIRLERDGQQAVLISPDGSIKGTKSWKPGVIDREATWDPAAKYLYFCSDRDDATFNVFRWNPQRDDAESRTLKGASRSYPSFAPDDTGETLLIVSQGNVRELDPKKKETPQILPPPSAEIVQGDTGEAGGSGATGTFSAVYGQLGNSFRVARYLPGRTAIVAVMRRDEGEVLVYQDLRENGGKLPRPVPVAAGDRVDFDIAAKDGTVAYTVQGFRWPDPAAAPPQYRKGNRITTPFRNMLGLFNPAATDPSERSLVVGASPDDKQGFASPRMAPDGARILLVFGAIEDGSLRPNRLIVVPAVSAGIGQNSVLVEGEVYEPTWSSDGQKIAYAKRVDGKRDLFTMGSDGTAETSVTKGQGDFAYPLFAPKQ